MPSKDIEKRRAAGRRWAEKHLKDPIVQLKRKARDKAYWNVDSQRCSIDGCEKRGELHHKDYNKPLEVVSLCKFHHESAHHSDHADGCTICGGKYLAKGYCNKHWKEAKRKDLIKNKHMNQIRQIWRRKRKLLGLPFV